MEPIEPGSVLAEGDKRLAAARAAFPGWDIRPIFGGYLAMPKGTPVVLGVDVDSITEKIKAQEKKTC